MLSREWRCSWSSADRRCSNYILVIHNYIAYQCAYYIRGYTIYFNTTAPVHGVTSYPAANICIADSCVHVTCVFVSYPPLRYNSSLAAVVSKTNFLQLFALFPQTVEEHADFENSFFLSPDLVMMSRNVSLELLDCSYIWQAQIQVSQQYDRLYIQSHIPGYLLTELHLCYILLPFYILSPFPYPLIKDTHAWSSSCMVTYHMIHIQSRPASYATYTRLSNKWMNINTYQTSNICRWLSARLQ